MKLTGYMQRVVLTAIILLAFPTVSRAEDCNQDNLSKVIGDEECLQIHTFGAESGNSGKPLVVFIHGDGSGGGPSDYMKPYAEKVAAQGGIGVVLIRPGYFDDAGNHSTGYSYREKGDGYRQDIIDSVAGAISSLKSFHGSAKVVLAGHSGGAAISGVILGQKPDLADAAVLASCPCNVSLWRRQNNRGKWPHSRSPHNYVDGIRKNVLLTALTGSDDTNTKPNLSESYIQELLKQGVAAKFILVDGASHNGVLRGDEFMGAVLGYL